MSLSKILIRRMLLLASAALLVLCTVFLLRITLVSPARSEQKATLGAVTSTAPKPEAVNPVLPPVRLKIPRINVDAAVEYVALTPKGDMDSPKDPSTVGWYTRGPRPGEIGSAVMDGHYGWKDGLPAVFDNLSSLRAGDKLYAEDKNKLTIAFTVRELRTYGKDDNTADVFYSNDKKAHLNLITCQGDWNKNQSSYSSRLVVFADKDL